MTMRKAMRDPNNKSDKKQLYEKKNYKKRQN